MRILIAAAAAVATMSLMSCGGGGGSGAGSAVRNGPPPSLALPRDRHRPYSSAGIVAQRAADARQMPIYQDGRYLFVGTDQGTGHIGSLPTVAERGEATVRHGRLSDGAGAATLSRYLSATVDDPSLKWKTAPVVYFGGGAGSPENFERAIRAVQLVNTILPENRRMRVASDGASPNPATGIFFRFADELGPDYWGITFNSNSASTNQITHSRITIYKDYTSNGDRQATILLAHELLHALGMFGGSGHVTEDIDSILEGGSGIYATAQGIPQPTSLLYPADREAMRALYHRLRDGDGPTDFGLWSSTSTHIAGTAPHSAFGVALRNGYAEPWAYGRIPGTDLADNRSLVGSTATWNGALLGLTPAAAVVAGDAAIEVNLEAITGGGVFTGTAAFTGLETWGANAAPGESGTGSTWLDGDLRYAINVRGNTFREVSGDAGSLTGVFVGRSHEGAAGTLERSDLTAAFGAAR